MANKEDRTEYVEYATLYVASFSFVVAPFFDFFVVFALYFIFCGVFVLYFIFSGVFVLYFVVYGVFVLYFIFSGFLWACCGSSSVATSAVALVSCVAYADALATSSVALVNCVAYADAAWVVVDCDIVRNVYVEVLHDKVIQQVIITAFRVT